jgi:hypothetical protein
LRRSSNSCARRGRCARRRLLTASWEWKVTDLEHIRPYFPVWILREEVETGLDGDRVPPGRSVTDDFASVYLAAREVGVQTLTDPRMRSDIEALGIRLANYADLAGGGWRGWLTGSR